MKTLIVLMLCGCLCAAAATAQVDPNSNGVGIYSDLGGLVNQVELEVGVPLEVYLLLTRANGTGGLVGWELDIVVPENVTIWGWNVPTPDAFVYSSPPSFAVVFPIAYPYQTAHHLMTFILIPLDSDPAQFFITGSSSSDDGDAPRYLDKMENRPGGDDMLFIEMIPYPEGMGVASFTVNPDVTPVVSASWGGVKALYR